MDKEKIMIVLLAGVLVLGLIMTSQSRWTVGEQEGTPLEQITQREGTGQPTTTDVENPHVDMMGGDAELNEEGFPEGILDLELVEFLTGQEAIEAIGQLHGTPIDVIDAQVASYGSGDREIEIWVSEAGSAEDTAQQIQLMTEMINTGEGPYTPTNVFQIAGTEIYQTQGLGMENYYFQQGAKAYWIGVRGLDPAPVLGLVMNTL